MKVLYACNFDIKRYSGKDRATRQKLNSLRVFVEDLHVVAAGRFKLVDFFIIDVKCVYKILRKQPDVFVSRGYIGLIPVLLCKLIGCKTFREVHADQIGEIVLLDKNYFFKKLLRIIGFYTVLIDRVADVRIFNHPQLMDWYDKKYGCGDLDFYCYNGYESKENETIDRKLILAKYGLPAGFDYFVFTGSASKWHGVDYLVDLQKQIDDIGYNIKIICAGGKVDNEIDPSNLLVNISPLDDKGCDEIISIAKACVLPVRNNRVSPGSPLKLYDYIKNQKFIIAQAEMLGYSDEVEKYGRGICVDFKDSRGVAEMISKLNYDKPILTPPEDFNWNARMKTWFNAFLRVCNDQIE